MKKLTSSTLAATSISVRVGRWFRASATGWGVIVLPLLVVVLAIAAGRLFDG